MKNIVLIGLPGSGKTTVGQLLAQKLHRPFVDTDALVENAAGHSIPEIFADEGEECFRERETEALLEALLSTENVIATGGGIVLRQENREMLRAAAVVFLDRAVEEITSTVSLKGRPLLRTKSLSDLADERRELYLQCADFSVSGGSPKDLVNAIIEKGEALCVF